MSFESISPNMSLPIPGAGLTAGPQWATDINNSLTIIDGHDHTAGSGVAITPGAMNINANLSMANNSLIAIGNLRFQVQSSLSASLASLYVSGVDLYYTDYSGNQVRITQSGGVAGSVGSISGLSSPASASYVSVSTKFVWQSGSNLAADMDFRSAILRNSGASSFGMTLQAPTLGADSAVTLPAVPAVTSFISITSAGAMGAAVPVSLGIDTANIANGAVTQAKRVALGQILSSPVNFSTTSTSFTDITGATVTITGTGRPIQVLAVPNATTASVFTVANGSSVAPSASIAIVRDVTSEVARVSMGINTGTTVQSVSAAPSIVNFIDTTASSAATYVYKLQVQVNAVTTTFSVQNISLIAYEL